MKHGDRLYLGDILRSIDYIRRFVATEIADDLKLQGCLYSLIVIGEAAKRLSPSLKERYSNVDWRRIVGLRNIVIHEYHDVNDEILWGIIHGDLDDLHSQMTSLLSDLDKDASHG